MISWWTKKGSIWVSPYRGNFMKIWKIKKWTHLKILITIFSVTFRKAKKVNLLISTKLLEGRIPLAKPKWSVTYLKNCIGITIMLSLTKGSSKIQISVMISPRLIKSSILTNHASNAWLTYKNRKKPSTDDLSEMP